MLLFKVIAFSKPDQALSFWTTDKKTEYQLYYYIEELSLAVK